MNTDDSQGFSAIELVAATAVLFLLLGALSPLANRVVSGSFTAKSGYEDIYRISRIQALFSRGCEDIDSSELNIPLRIHRNGLVTFADGTANPIMQRGGALAPSSRDDAATFMRLIPEAAIDLKVIAEGALFLGCPRYGAQISYDNIHGFAAVAADGLLEISLAAQKPDSRGCRRLTLSPSRSMSLTPGADIRLVRTLIPIRDHYTLYLDREGRLRYLAHEGARNIENQPLVEGLSALKLSAARLKSEVTRIHITVELGREQHYELFLHHRIARSMHLNLLLNRPG